MTKILLLGLGRWGANHLRILNSLPIHGEMALDAADKVADAIAEFYGKK